MESLITTDEARRQLRLTEGDLTIADTAAAVAEKSVQATDAIIDYIERPDHGWTAETVPPVVKAAVLLMLSQLYDDAMNATITDAIKNLLRRYRKPALA